MCMLVMFIRVNIKISYIFNATHCKVVTLTGAKGLYAKSFEHPETHCLSDVQFVLYFQMSCHKWINNASYLSPFALHFCTLTHWNSITVHLLLLYLHNPKSTLLFILLMNNAFPGRFKSRNKVPELLLCNLLNLVSHITFLS